MRGETRLAALWLALATACAHGPGAPGGADRAAVVAAVGEAEDARVVDGDAIPRALALPDPAVRRIGLWALGRIEAAGTATLAAPYLLDEDPSVAAAAAFALGQIGTPDAQVALRGGLPETKAPQAALRALSRCGTASVANDMLGFVGRPEPGLRAEAILSIGLLKKRLGAAVPDDVGARLLPGLTDPSPGVRYAAAYATARFEGPAAAVELVPVLADPDAETRMWAAHGLGASGAGPATLDAIMRDPDWRVRAKAAWALGEMAKRDPSQASGATGRLLAIGKRTFKRVVEGDRLTAGREMHVLRAAIEASTAAGEPGRRVLTTLEGLTWETEGLPADSAADLARVQCDVAYALDRLDGVSRRIETCGQEVYPAWRRRARALALVAAAGGATAEARIEPYARDSDPRVRAAAVMALGELETAASAAILLGLLQSNDVYVIAAAAEILARPSRAGLRPPALAETLGAALDRLVLHPDDSVFVGLIDGIGAFGPNARPLAGRLATLARQDPRPGVRRRAAAAHLALTGERVAWASSRPAARRSPRPAPVARAVRLGIDTARGSLVVELDGRVAPRFTGVLRALAAAGFYDGLTLHRIVSTFVAQGGCPRGDGWGGPGYTVPGETSARPFVRGALGIATNGRDTGGSQFFFMHAYHPHLDGGYPWVGRVVDGIDVVDALQPDDAIRRVRVLDAP